MTDVEKQLKAAFEAIEVPDDLNDRTLARIEMVRQQQEGEVIRTRTTTVSPSERKTVPFRKRIAFAAAACLIVALAGVFGVRTYFSPTAYVSIDMNPSIELEMNCFDKVISATGMNDDGQKIVDQVKVVGLSYDEAIHAITQDPQFVQYMNDDSFVQVSVSCDNAQQQTKLMLQSEQQLQTLPCESSCGTVNNQTRLEASEAGMAMGRYIAALDAMQADPTLTLDECSRMNMRQLKNIAMGSSDETPGGMQHHSETESGHHYQEYGHHYGNRN